LSLRKAGAVILLILTHLAVFILGGTLGFLIASAMISIKEKG
jgi:hypothetical protein